MPHILNPAAPVISNEIIAVPRLNLLALNVRCAAPPLSPILTTASAACGSFFAWARKLNTASWRVRNTVYPSPRARNLTAAPVCPVFSSKSSGSFAYAAIAAVLGGAVAMARPEELPEDCARRVVVAQSAREAAIAKQPVYEVARRHFMFSSRKEAKVFSRL
jgi:hypothetical protein